MLHNNGKNILQLLVPIHTCVMLSRGGSILRQRPEMQRMRVQERSIPEEGLRIVNTVWHRFVRQELPEVTPVETV
jgi:hypothetical protein